MLLLPFTEPGLVIPHHGHLSRHHDVDGRVVVDYVVGRVHQHGTDLDENPGRGAVIQGHITAVSTEHNFVDPVSGEESKVPGILESNIS